MKLMIFKKILTLFLLGLLISPITSWADKNPIVDIETSQGLITVELEQFMAPVTVNNFLEYVQAGVYEGTLFHRIIEGFMVQGGGFYTDLSSVETREPIDLETNRGLSNKRGTITMARRTNEPDSATAQFFINTVDNLFLDYEDASSPGYAVFGTVIEGMEIVDAISAIETGTFQLEEGQLTNFPKVPVVINAIRPREGQLSFNGIKESYIAGDHLAINLVETMIRDVPLDLWFGIMTETGELLYVTKTGFSLEPQAFMTDISKQQRIHSVLGIVIPEGIAGNYTLLAIFNNPGDGLEDLQHSLRSNIISAVVKIVE